MPRVDHHSARRSSSAQKTTKALHLRVPTCFPRNSAVLFSRHAAPPPACAKFAHVRHQIPRCLGSGLALEDMAYLCPPNLKQKSNALFLGALWTGRATCYVPCSKRLGAVTVSIICGISTARYAGGCRRVRTYIHRRNHPGKSLGVRSACSKSREQVRKSTFRATRSVWVQEAATSFPELDRERRPATPQTVWIEVAPDTFTGLGRHI
ncbi:hypothetical protein BC834DRAFT_574859 [Gloeopeniophorella convolvens]|nr:hypothetical protein BC834DRAFT_574859 [Gloeopeniophorella convolvens]